MLTATDGILSKVEMREINNKKEAKGKEETDSKYGVRFCSSLLHCHCFYGGKTFQEVLALPFH